MTKPAPGRRGHRIQNFFDVYRDPIQFLTHLRDEYGTTYRYDAANENVVVVLEPDEIKEVLVSKAKSFHKLPILKRESIVFGEESVLLIEDEDHRRMRKLLQPAFHRKAMVNYGEIIQRHTKEWVESHSAGELDFFREMNVLTEDIITEALFGNSLGERGEELTDAFMTINLHFISLSMPLSKLWLQLPLPGMAETRQALRVVEEEVMRVVEERRENPDKEGDLLSMLLAAQDVEPGLKPLNNQEVHDQVATLFLAGHETTACALTWTCYLLAKHPDIQEKVRQEIKEAMTEGPLGFETVSKLKLTRAVISESLRLYPPIWNLGRHAMEDMELGEFEIKKSDFIILLQYLVHRDPRWWPDPERFDPNRWLDESLPKRHKFAYFPFGGGARVCIGEALAWMETSLVLAGILENWKISLSEKTEEKPELFLSVTLAPKNGMPLHLDSI